MTAKFRELATRAGAPPRGILAVPGVEAPTDPRARVAELVEAVRTARNDIERVAVDARDYDCGASPDEWAALQARFAAANERFDAALSELAALAMPR